MNDDNAEVVPSHPAGHRRPGRDPDDHRGDEDADTAPPPSAVNMLASGRRTRWGDPNW